MKVFLIQLPNVVSESEARHLPPYLSVGLGILASVLRDEGHQVKLLDAYTEGWDHRARIEGDRIEIGLAEEEIAAQIRRFQPHVVGFSVPFTTMVPRLRSLARWVKAIHPEIFIVCGGNHPTCAPREILAISEIDAVVLGEAERTFPRLLQALEEAAEYKNLPGLACADAANEVAQNPPAEIIADLDTLPLPAYDLLPLKKYFKAAGSRKIPMFTSRGCSQACASCSLPLTSVGPVRHYSPEYVCQAMRHLAEFYGVREFLFEDDMLIKERQAANSFFDRLIQEDLHAHWAARGGVAPEILDEALLAKMRRSGGRELCFAVGSGSRRVLHRILHKKLDLYALEEAIKRSLAAGFAVSCEFLLGSPGATLEEVYETLNFAWKLRSLGVEKFSFLLSTPYVGTALRAQATELGWPVPPADPEFFPHDDLVETNNLVAMEIAQIRDTAQREFNSHGLVLELGKLMGVGAKVIKAEERFFASVAPWPALYHHRPQSKERDRVSESA